MRYVFLDLYNHKISICELWTLRSTQPQNQHIWAMDSWICTSTKSPQKNETKKFHKEKPVIWNFLPWLFWFPQHVWHSFWLSPQPFLVRQLAPSDILKHSQLFFLFLICVCYYDIIWTLVESFISRWALSISQCWLCHWITLFSASEQTHCILIRCDSQCVCVCVCVEWWKVGALT